MKDLADMVTLPVIGFNVLTIKGKVHTYLARVWACLGQTKAVEHLYNFTREREQMDTLNAHANSTFVAQLIKASPFTEPFMKDPADMVTLPVIGLNALTIKGKVRTYLAQVWACRGQTKAAEDFIQMYQRTGAYGHTQWSQGCGVILRSIVSYRNYRLAP